MKNKKQAELNFWKKAIRTIHAMTEDVNRSEEAAHLTNLESSLKKL